MRFIVALILCVAFNARGAVSAIDSDGRRVTLDAPAQRIVSLAPHITEQLFAIGAGSKIVAASEYSDYPPEAAALPRVSNSGTVNLEAVIALRPDLVIAWRLEAITPALKRLESLGLTVFYDEPHRLEQIAEMIEALGELTGRAGQAGALAASLRKELARLEAKYRGRRPVSLFYQIADHPLMTLNGQHFVSDAIRLCGGRNIFANARIIAPVVNLEAVLAADPEAIVTARPNPGDTTWQALWRRFPALRAVQQGNLFAVPMNEMHRHGPRALGAAAELCEKLDQARLKASNPR
jgi:iron complex transport system substrate-binding protein